MTDEKTATITQYGLHTPATYVGETAITGPTTSYDETHIRARYVLKNYVKHARAAVRQSTSKNCPYCRKPFATHDGLYRHVRGKHTAEITELPPVEVVDEAIRRRVAADLERRLDEMTLAALQESRPWRK